MIPITTSNSISVNPGRPGSRVRCLLIMREIMVDRSRSGPLRGTPRLTANRPPPPARPPRPCRAGIGPPHGPSGPVPRPARRRRSSAANAAVSRPAAAAAPHTRVARSRTATRGRLRSTRIIKAVPTTAPDTTSTRVPLIRPAPTHISEAAARTRVRRVACIDHRTRVNRRGPPNSSVAVRRRTSCHPSGQSSTSCASHSACQSPAQPD